MMTMTILDVSILAAHLFTACFCGSKGGAFEGRQ